MFAMVGQNVRIQAVLGCRNCERIFDKTGGNMIVSKSFIKQQVQQFVREVFADTLRKEGFTSYKNEDISWFRVINHEVVHHVCFVTPWRHCGTTLFMSLGCYPLYANIDIPTTPYMYDCHIGDPPLVYSVILSPEILYPGSGTVMCPRDGTYGLKVLKEKVLPQFEGMDSSLACYNRHIEIRLDGLRLSGEKEVSLFKYQPYNDFIAEIIYQDDSKLYGELLAAIEIYRQEELSDTVLSPQTIQERLTLYNTWEAAIAEDRKPFIDELEKRKADFLKKLQKGGIPV